MPIKRLYHMPTYIRARVLSIALHTYTTAQPQHQPCRSLSLYLLIPTDPDRSLLIPVDPCRSRSIPTDPCRSLSIPTDPCRSLLIPLVPVVFQWLIILFVVYCILLLQSCSAVVRFNSSAATRCHRIRGPTSPGA